MPPISNTNKILFEKNSKISLKQHFDLYEVIKKQIKKLKLVCKKIDNFSNLEIYQDDTIYTNSSDIYDDFNLLECGNFQKIYCSAPNILSSIMIYPKEGTCPKMVRVDGNFYVIVNLKNDAEYIKNYQKLKGVFKQYSNDIAVLEEVGIVKSSNSLFFISKFCGFDFETLILDFKKEELKPLLFNVSFRTERILRQHNLFWRNISPRNMIKGVNNKVYLIDYDHLNPIISKSSVDLFKDDQNRRLWFADIFENNEIDRIFINYDFDQDNLKIIPNEYDDPFIKNPCETLTPMEYIQVFKSSVLIELPKKESINYHGHILGRFVSDYWPGQAEIELATFVFEHQEYLESILELLKTYSQKDQETCLVNSIYNLNNDYQSYTKFLEFKESSLKK